MSDGRPKAVLFDAGNTLIYVDPGRLSALFRTLGVPAVPEAVRNAELVARRRLHEAFTDGHVGTEPAVWHAYFTELFVQAGVPAERMADVSALLRDTHASDHLWTHVEEGTREALDALAASGHRLAVISNADGRVEEVLERVGLRSRFEFVIDSAVVGVEKPDPRIFAAACDRLGLEPGDCLYVGDLYPVDYLGARRAGMEAVLLDPLGIHRERAPTVNTLRVLPDFVADPASAVDERDPRGPISS